MPILLTSASAFQPVNLTSAVMMTLMVPLPLLVEAEHLPEEVAVAAPVLWRGQHLHETQSNFHSLENRADGGHNPGNNLHVSGLSGKIDQRDLEAAFSKYGRVSSQLLKFI
jgi:hypothetical protein